MMKTCPYCAEEIQDAAIVCKHCGRDLQTGAVPAATRTWSPGIAAVLSLVIPGAGQMYRGTVGAGLLWLFAVASGYLVFVGLGVLLHLLCVLRAASGATVAPTTAARAPMSAPPAPVDR